MSHLALYRKWRPLDFDDVFGQNHITSALQNQVAAERVSHAYLFTGTRGTGKTTCAKILARAACCEHPENGNPCNKCSACLSILQDSAMDVTEIDAASNNGVDNIREIRDEAAYAPTALTRRVYIIDEVHMLSQGAFNALLKTLEEPPPHVLFILATTEIHKVPATILSRCQRYDFRRIPPEIITKRLLQICKSEHISISDDAGALLARLGDGSMRDGISLLDRCLTQGNEITAATVADGLGIASSQTLQNLYNALLAGDSAAALQYFTACYLDGRDIISLFDELLSLIRDIYILKTTGLSQYLMSACASDLPLLQKFAQESDPLILEFFVSCLNDLLSRLTRTAIRRTDAEVCLIKMCMRHSNMPLQQAPAAVVAKPISATSKKAEEPETPPWDAPVEVVAKREKPAPKAETRSESPIKGPFVSQVSGKVNSAVRVYLDFCEYEVQNDVLTIGVPEEAIGFMEKASNLAIFTEAAQALGQTSVRITKKGAKKAHQSGGLDDILNNAKNLGIPIK